ncbi:MAG: hypothetical protein OEX21_09420, partial [Betaproteobacteria bacterium]|nr:hypothetical protein [Betaproteobacteria bacterium]
MTARALFLVFLSLPGLAFAQASATTRVSGSFGGSDSVGSLQITFTCTGTPTCTGQFNLVETDSFCANTITESDAFTMTGLNLGQSGALQGTMTFAKADNQYTRLANGNCVIAPGATDAVVPYTGTWDLATRTGSITVVAEQSFPGTIKADLTPPPPVFPMTVTASITPTSATVSADIQYRPQDVGTSGSVYVFALAPADLVRPSATGASFTVGKTVPARGAKAEAVACVLAQLNSSGQLQAVSSSSLQAYVSGVLSAQGQSVQIVNGVSTVNIGGATFYVGYGTSSAAMIENGINRSAITVPAARECRPQPPQTGWWWNPAESGRGFSIESSGNNLFMAAYLYDVSGRSTWHVAVGPTSLDGSVFSSQLLTFGSGVTLTGAYRANAPLPGPGAISLTFDDAQHGTLVWPGGTLAIERFPVSATGPATPALANQPQSGWWWGGNADSGRGFFIEWQGANAFLAGYMYDSQGNPTWYVAQNAAPIA